ncbi:MAG TPA: DUF1203 domain-containing protein [Steroidobacteraceae bacterium]|jgi:hypothetical protein|nr:DUF1203 domain-containing protein [Steroidobacteraceae bacterium]
MRFRVRGVPQEIADEVRRTRLSPGYGHPAHLELAAGTGPCRCCLRPFVPGREQRLLFTYRPSADACDGNRSLMAPGPVFIHAEHCDAYVGDGFPDALRSVALAFEGRASGSRVCELSARADVPAEAQIKVLFDDHFAQWLHLRHAQAGCYIARIDRA